MNTVTKENTEDGDLQGVVAYVAAGSVTRVIFGVRA
jgi:hypothetical protein